MGEFDPMNVLAQPPIKALQAQGCQVRVHMMQGVGHDFPGDIIAEIEDILQELKEQRQRP